MRTLGNTVEAERFYRDGLEIIERLAEADPGNSSAQRDLSVFYNKLGDLMRTLGKTDEAERFHRAAAGALGLASPRNEE